MWNGSKLTRVVTVVMPSGTILASPKSAILASKAESKRMFAGLMSRCTIWGLQSSCRYVGSSQGGRGRRQDEVMTSPSTIMCHASRSMYDVLWIMQYVTRVNYNALFIMHYVSCIMYNALCIMYDDPPCIIHYSLLYHVYFFMTFMQHVSFMHSCILHRCFRHVKTGEGKVVWGGYAKPLAAPMVIVLRRGQVRLDSESAPVSTPPTFNFSPSHCVSLCMNFWMDYRSKHSMCVIQ